MQATNIETLHSETCLDIFSLNLPLERLLNAVTMSSFVFNANETVNDFNHVMRLIRRRINTFFFFRYTFD